MPELPEVETVRRGLERLIVGKKIQSVKVSYPKLVLTGLDSFEVNLIGQTIQAMRRRGKYLIFDLGSQVIISHLRMEGKYLVFPDQVPDNKHFHAFFKLSDGSTLIYQDVRKFGTMELLSKDDEEAYFAKKKLGPEPTKESFKLKPFEEALLSSQKLIKPYLLEQRLVVGLGNIYVDEVLWAARVHPGRVSSSLKKAEIKSLHDETIRILGLAVEKGGSTIRSYKNALGEDGTMQDYHQVYGKTGQPCPRCGREIVKIQLKGRGSHFCPRCQKE
ncbi:DNA-formamidopyrimidine glycosylase [Streptococcus loxodontisalivarius]|uniref:Formamidopyrimidine-DNA glycosylase n=1 Tax=Streptococcus loxodontisalivarius TaxID=1349415 RepID=A0ABS2PSG7_9STRE|nr:DNA-formamidopyrimidine glycosylase [Streptococcus loxodontisalivarius]MBM7642322.1 formamidopyrimidine-DNA glycosylase [Streptococcus loxodontisalivarius]